MDFTTDPNDPRLSHGPDAERVGQNEVYLILSEEERAKGFVRPVRRSYRHVGRPGPRYPLRDLTHEERRTFVEKAYIQFEEYPESGLPATGRFWTQDDLDSIDNGCGLVTTMGLALAETYASSPGFYGATYCVYCSKHLPVGSHGEFVWDDGTRVGT